jgi:DNA-binding SARP family transcriptional activator
MMSLLALSGQRGAALRQHEICRRALVRELDVGPDVETTKLYEQIRSAESIPPMEAARTWPDALQRPRDPFGNHGLFSLRLAMSAVG